MEKLMDMTITAEYLTGKKNNTADVLSRTPMWRESGIEDPLVLRRQMAWFMPISSFGLPRIVVLA